MSHDLHPSPNVAPCCENIGVTNGERLLDEFRRERRAGDPRLSPEGREILRRITSGDLADEFADALASVSEPDPSLGPNDSVDPAR